MSNLSENLRKLRQKYKLSINKLATLSGINKSTISEIENEKISNPSRNTLEKLSSALKISVDDLLGNIKKEEAEKLELNKRDLRDISKDVDSIMDKLDKGESGPSYYNGIEMKEEDKELFRSAIELALKTIKVKNKETYTPKKYRK
ncbi:MAG: helix-turn-helix domain-containing protein [Clostridium sp.]|jgi:transcriptional regulator with XRE-family HTH domain|uniref:helix-turn-helix domain-containing protein n=1 Tax=Clostridium sp. TaxID=1506 RepID=UPI0025B97CD0|nr:helix-turn-helix transcriptional regulator [Clostridium sp.]MCH3962651.1 helix-turn-helix domain-containing protein [Clostridium sp.]MCI2201037.1 helix-turn-helix domain-containing protein [Clostridium sp.]